MLCIQGCHTWPCSDVAGARSSSPSMTAPPTSSVLAVANSSSSSAVGAHIRTEQNVMLNHINMHPINI